MDWIAIIIGSAVLIVNVPLLVFNIRKYRAQSAEIKAAKERAKRS